MFSAASRQDRRDHSCVHACQGPHSGPARAQPSRPAAAEARDHAHFKGRPVCYSAGRRACRACSWVCIWHSVFYFQLQTLLPANALCLHLLLTESCERLAERLVQLPQGSTVDLNLLCVWLQSQPDARR